MTRYVGVDLAWGVRNQTGLAVLDDDGQLLDVTARRTDQELLDWLTPQVEGACVVGVDASIIVRNESGQRPCERLVARYFGRFHAGPYPSNTSQPHFAESTRAQRLADALSLDVDPRSRAERRMIEVYPHPAIVMLFDLARVLAYKGKAGRELDSRRAALLVLIEHLSSLADADPALRLDSPAWAGLVESIRSAPTKAALDRSEDPVDAVVCAYVARLYSHAPARTRVIGDHATGYIVVPVNPAMADLIDADGPPY